jgi:hypothetical protein
MNKKVLTFGILIIVLAGIFVPASRVFAQTTNANLPACNLVLSETPQKCLGVQHVGKTCMARWIPDPNSVTNGDTYEYDCVDPKTGETSTTTAMVGSTGGTQSVFETILNAIAGFITRLLMGISSLFLIFAGTIFDWIVNFSIVDMAQNMGSSSNLGKSISDSWTTLRDIANLVFIFVLLYAAFSAMFDSKFGNFQNTVKNIIIVALLINFSLFFSKVVIDASNIVAIGFYKSISSSATLGNSSSGVSGTNTFDSISSGYMNMLGMQTVFSSNVLTANLKDPVQILIIGVMSSIFMLITAIILFISAIMFATRFILLIFIMILSPLALISYIIPGLNKYFDQWTGALVSQSFFAPLFFALTWVVFRLGTSLKETLLKGQNVDLTNTFTNPGATAGILVNYILIIGFAIAALVFSKTMAGKTAGFKVISGGIGAAAAGSTAWGGRLIARGANAGFTGLGTSINKLAGKDVINLQESAAKGSSFARLALYGKKKAENATFDVRNATIPTRAIGEAIQGTVGRTQIGKTLGLNDVNIPSVPLSSVVSDMSMLGKGGTKGFKAITEEREKRVREADAKEKAELELSRAKKDISEGAKAGEAMTPVQKDAMEQSLTKLSDKQTETLVAGDRELLKSMNFANAISVKQLEAINKSDQFSDDEKNNLKSNRFKEIEDIANPAGLAAIDKKEKGETLTDDEIKAAALVDKARKRTKDLSDSEIEMMSPNYFDNKTPEGREFMLQLRAGQAEVVTKNKSGKFTATQREQFKEERLKPLRNALEKGDKDKAKKLMKGVDVKTIISYMKTKGKEGGENIAFDPTVLEAYSPKILSKLAAHEDITAEDVSKLRDAIIKNLPSDNSTVKWLNDPKTGEVEFPK